MLLIEKSCLDVLGVTKIRAISKVANLLFENEIMIMNMVLALTHIVLICHERHGCLDVTIMAEHDMGVQQQFYGLF